MASVGKVKEFPDTASGNLCLEILREFNPDPVEPPSRQTLAKWVLQRP